MNDSANHWFIRLAGKEYGPADLATLREWKEEGRVLSTNEARAAEEDEHWIRAAEIPGLFSPEPPPLPPPVQSDENVPPPPGIFRICVDSVVLYVRGFFPFLGLTLLIVIPSVLSQVTAAVLDEPGATDLDSRSLLAAAFSFCMLLLMLAAWPVYVTGIQILTSDLALGRPVQFLETLSRAMKFWPRVAALCLFVYGSFAFWMILPMIVIVLIALAGPSVLSFFLVLLVAVVQIWVVGRLFVNFLFWQQCAVLDEYDVPGALRESKLLARSGREVPWYKRPLWQGVFVSSLWVLFVLAVNLPILLPAYHEYLRLISANPDPQKLFEAMSNLPKAHGIDRLNFALALLKAMLQPLLGIAFVLIFFAAKSRVLDNGSRRS
jgi:hypothetical protein